MPGGYYSAADSGVARAVAVSAFLFLVAFYSFRLYRAADSIFFYDSSHTRALEIDSDRCPFLDGDKCSLRRVLLDASMPEKTVILTTLNEAWAAPDSVFDLFLESFRIGEGTRHLLNHLVIISLDRGAFFHCIAVHTYCYALITDEVNFSHEAYFMTPKYLKMMWRRIDFLGSVLEMGFNFVFTGSFPRFHPQVDFQMACDHFTGEPEDVRNIPNGGFSFVRSNNRSISFYKFWYASRTRYPGLHDQDVLIRIKNSIFVRDIGIKMRFLDTDLFGGFCEPSKDITRVCTMHANCCLGLSTKLHDLRILLENWKKFVALPGNLDSYSPSWSVPQNCSIESLLHDGKNPQKETATMEVPGSSKKMIATQEEMMKEKVPLAYRDQCAHLLIPLNKCRRAEFFLPWKCENERHVYEKCEYELVMERLLQMQKIREREAQLKAHSSQSIPLVPKTANA